MKTNFNKLEKVIIKIFFVGLISIVQACVGTKPVSDTEAHPTDGQASRIKKTFFMQYSVTTNIKARQNKIWALLTNVPEYPTWNSTVDSIKGQIALGEKIKLFVKISPGREFSLKISEFSPEQRLVWEDGTTGIFKGVRTYTLSPKEDGSTEFTMTEAFTGIMVPMIAGSLPDFRPSFEQYAADLKRKAESGAE